MSAFVLGPITQLPFPGLQNAGARLTLSIWFAKQPTWREVAGPVNLADFIYLGDIRAETLENAFELMQGESYSPNGEASRLIRSLGLTHTSMSVGDLVLDRDSNRWNSVCFNGFKEVQVKA